MDTEPLDLLLMSTTSAMGYPYSNISALDAKLLGLEVQVTKVIKLSQNWFSKTAAQSAV
jgi:hypothetical protein